MGLWPSIGQSFISNIYLQYFFDGCAPEEELMIIWQKNECSREVLSQLTLRR